MRATFVFPNSRASLAAGVAAGTEPDSTLLGANHLADEHVEVTIHDPVLSRRPLRPPFDRVAWNLRELTLPLELGRADVVFTPLANVLPLTARVRQLPVVVVNYGLNLIWRRASTARRSLLGRSLRAAAAVVCLGRSQQEELVREAELERARTILLPVDERFFTPLEDDVAEASVLTVGKDLARDYATFADAVGPLGVPVHMAVYERNVTGVRLPSNATVRRLSSLELRAAYGRAACVVLPQRRDSYPFGSEGGGLTALLEAMAMGRPVVASERAILRDYVTHGVDALLVPPEDPAALRDAIQLVLADRALAERLGAAARARVEREHSTRGFAAQLARLLESVVYPR
jgi:glycosyltransferase involved in cell wall biosynthesis